MRWNRPIRQLHRWVSLIFVLVVAGIFAALGLGLTVAEWIYYLPLPPLFILLLSGIYMFVLPYLPKGRGATFAHGAALPDPKGLFNGKDNGKTRRSIDIFEGDALDEAALRELVRAAIAYNLEHLKKNRT